MDNSTMNFENYTVEEFVNFIREIVEDVLISRQKNIEKYYNGIIVNANNESNPLTGTVDIDGLILTNLNNRSSMPLTSGDVVRVYYTNENLSDAYIGRKL